MLRSTVLRSLAALALFAAVHSALAAEPTKRRVRALVGDRRADGLYRAAYNAAAVPATGLLAAYLWRLPDRPLYRVEGRPRALMAGGQALALLGVGAVALRVGPARFVGLPQLLDLAAGRPIRPAVAAQRPLSAGADLGWGGPFALCRHPNNAFPLVALWLGPTMTAKWAAVGLGATLYMWLGSRHEERRLERAYAERFARYRSKVPRLLLPLGRLALLRAPAGGGGG